MALNYYQNLNDTVQLFIFWNVLNKIITIFNCMKLDATCSCAYFITSSGESCVCHHMTIVRKMK